MKDTGKRKLQILTSQFYRVNEAKKCVVRPEFLQESPDGPLLEPMKVKPMFQ